MCPNILYYCPSLATWPLPNIACSTVFSKKNTWGTPKIWWLIIIFPIQKDYFHLFSRVNPIFTHILKYPKIINRDFPPPPLRVFKRAVPAAAAVLLLFLPLAVWSTWWRRRPPGRISPKGPEIDGFLLESDAGWWLTYPFEKIWRSVGRMKFPIYGK